MEYTTIKPEIKNHTGIIIFNRPDEGNSVMLKFMEELAHISEIYKEDKNIRVVVLKGSGSHFSVGGDLKAFAAEGSGISPHLRQVTLHLNTAIINFVKMKKPVIAAVNGTVAGAGMGLVCAADIVVATEKARFVMAYTKAGLTPDGATSYFLPRLIGMKKSLELSLLNRMLTAEEAKEWGLITETCSDTELENTTNKLAERMAEGATEAFGLTKELLYSSFHHTLEDQTEKESLLIAEKTASPEGQEGINAFLEKRKPEFPK